MRPFIKPDLGLHRFILVQVTTVEYAFVLLEASVLFLAHIFTCLITVV
jgi:hypothetical protein